MHFFSKTPQTTETTERRNGIIYIIHLELIAGYLSFSVVFITPVNIDRVCLNQGRLGRLKPSILENGRIKKLYPISFFFLVAYFFRNTPLTPQTPSAIDGHIHIIIGQSFG